MTTNNQDQHHEGNQHYTQESDLPIKLSKPAQRALAGAGIVQLEQLTNFTEAEVMKLHGMGPHAMKQLLPALAAKGLSFAQVNK